MEYYEIQQLWDKSEEDSLDVSLNAKAVNELTHNKVHFNLQEIRWGSVIEVVVNFFWINYLFQLMQSNLQDISFLIAGIVLFLLAMYSLILEINKLYLVTSIDYNFSIIKAQRKLEKLKLLENLDLNSLYFIIPMSVIPFMIVLGEGVFDIDFESIGIGATEMMSAVFGSIVVAAIIVYILRRTEFSKLSESLDFLEDLKGE